MIYLYDVIHYAHTRTSVPTSARTPKRKTRGVARTHRETIHTFRSLVHPGVSAHMYTRAGIHTRVRTYARARARACARTRVSVCERRRATTNEYTCLYVCTCTYSEYLTNVFYRFFLRNFVTARIGRKCDRDLPGQCSSQSNKSHRVSREKISSSFLSIVQYIFAYFFFFFFGFLFRLYFILFCHPPSFVYYFRSRTF